MIVKMRKGVKPVIVIEQKGKDFTYTIKTPICTQVHSFTIGKETEMTCVDGRKFKVRKASLCRLESANFIEGCFCTFLVENSFLKMHQFPSALLHLCQAEGN